MRNRWTLAAAAALATPILAASAALAGPVVYDFADNDAFDGTGVGAFADATDGVATVRLTTLDVQAPQYNATTLTGAQTSAAGRAGFVAALNVTQTLTAVSTTQMGINNITLSDASAVTAGLGGSEAGNVNVNEAWVFRFDTAVVFAQMNLASVDAADTITVTVGATSFTLVDGQTNDDYNDPFGGLLIPANTEISFKNTTNGGVTPNSIVRIDSFTVTVPEPATLAAFGAAGLLARRRRR